MQRQGDTIFTGQNLMLALCQSVKNVLNTATGDSISYSPMMQKIGKTCLTPDIGTFVMFTGSMAGLVVINFPKDTAMEIYSSYMTSMGLDEKDLAANYTSDEVSDSLGELMNQIIGSFTREMSNKLRIQLSQSQPKMLVMPQEVQININLNLDNPLYGRVTFFTGSGKVFYVELAINDTEFTLFDNIEEKQELSPDDILEAVLNGTDKIND